MGELWLAGETILAMAHAMAVSEHTIRHHLDATIKPLWRKEICDPLGMELARIKLLERTAWHQFNSKTPCETTEQVKDGLLEGGVKMGIVERVPEAHC